MRTFLYFPLQKIIIVQKAMEAWDDVSSALLHFLEPGQENTTVLSDTLSQVLKKDTAARLSVDPITIPGSGNSTGITFIKLPPLGSSQSDVMGIQVSSRSVVHGASLAFTKFCIYVLLYIDVLTFSFFLYNFIESE